MPDTLSLSDRGRRPDTVSLSGRGGGEYARYTQILRLSGHEDARCLTNVIIQFSKDASISTEL